MAQMPGHIAAGPVELRRWRTDGIDDMLAAVTASFPELHQWMDWADTLPTRDDLSDIMSSSADAFDRDVEWNYGLHEVATGEVVGSMGLHQRLGPGALEIGYWVRTDRTGRGYVTAAARALTMAAFDSIPTAGRVEIHMDAANHRSAAVPRRLGYTLTETVEREISTPGHTGRGLIWTMTRRDYDAGALTAS